MKLLEKTGKLFSKFADNIRQNKSTGVFMARISPVSSNNYTTAADTVKNNGDNNLHKEKLVFSPSELGLNRKRPATIVLTER